MKRSRRLKRLSPREQKIPYIFNRLAKEQLLPPYFTQHFSVRSDKRVWRDYRNDFRDRADILLDVNELLGEEGTVLNWQAYREALQRSLGPSFRQDVTSMFVDDFQSLLLMRDPLMNAYEEGLISRDLQPYVEQGLLPEELERSFRFTMQAQLEKRLPLAALISPHPIPFLKREQHSLLFERSLKRAACFLSGAGLLYAGGEVNSIILSLVGFATMGASFSPGITFSKRARQIARSVPSEFEDPRVISDLERAYEHIENRRAKELAELKDRD